jgi:superfamily I DNA/RNA helicase
MGGYHGAVVIPMSYLHDLNPEQRKAVEAGEGPILIIAGPGTGKTKTLTTRIVHLIAAGLATPGEVLALTFTNKAAREMQGRVKVQLPKGKLPNITTFHALALSTLGPKGAVLASPQTVVEILRSLKKTYGKQWSQRDLSLLVSNAKNSLAASEDPAVARVVETYNAELSRRGLCDFDDLLLQLRQKLQQETTKQYTHILVDEFQDTNELQYELIKLLNKTGNLFVIGDPLQAIYGFRGASDGIFNRFRQDWPAISEIHLTTNYRSAPGVVNAANAIFPDAARLVPHRKTAGGVQIVEVLNEYSEADWVVAEIERRIGGSDLLKSSQYHDEEKQRCFGDFAVLYRTHAVARTLQKALESSGIPYQVAGEGSPYTQPHIQELLLALAYIAGTGDMTPGRLTKTQYERLLDPLKGRELGVAQLAGQIAEALVLSNGRNQAELAQFIGALARFGGMKLRDYLDHVQAIAEQEYYDPQADAVSLMTIHAAKGLEFSQVILLAAEQGIMPLLRKDKPADMAEEKRLFYVAATRARDDLFMLYGRKRAREARELSEFLQALPEALAPRITDQQMAAQVRKLQQRQQKRAQSTLF